MVGGLGWVMAFFIDFFMDCYAFQFYVGRFFIGCGSKFRAEVAYLEVGRLDLEQIREIKLFLMKLEFFFVCPQRPSARNPGEK